MVVGTEQTTGAHCAAVIALAEFAAVSAIVCVVPATPVASFAAVAIAVAGLYGVSVDFAVAAAAVYVTLAQLERMAMRVLSDAPGLLCILLVLQ